MRGLPEFDIYRVPPRWACCLLNPLSSSTPFLSSFYAQPKRPIVWGGGKKTQQQHGNRRPRPNNSIHTTAKCVPRRPAADRGAEFDEFPAVTSRSISLSSPPKGALNQQQGIGHRRGDSRAESRTACRPLPSSTKPVCWCPLCRLR